MSTLVAGASALAILVTTVLPAEYAIDPTGIGRMLGLTQMGEIKKTLATEAASDASAILNDVAQTEALNKIVERLDKIEERLNPSIVKQQTSGAETPVEGAEQKVAVTEDPPEPVVEEPPEPVVESPAKKSLPWRKRQMQE